MILLLTNDGDFSSNVVMSEIRSLGCECLRINTSDVLNGRFELDVYRGVPSFNGVQLRPEDINSVWFRKFGFYNSSPQHAVVRRIFEGTFPASLSAEFAKVIDYLEFLFRKAFWLTSPKTVRVNKMIALSLAQEVGFDVPLTRIVSRRDDLVRAESEIGPLITKSAYDPNMVNYKGVSYSMFTKTISKDDIEKLPERFMPSLVQQRLCKRYEVRTFYLMGKCYSMAILSQRNSGQSITMLSMKI